MLITGAVLLVRGRVGSLPTTITAYAGFPLYYPSPTPRGYGYKKGSAKIENGVVFYTLKDGASTVVVTEQAAPMNPPDLSHLVGFTTLKTIAGDAVMGTARTKQPIAIIVSNTTLITVTGKSSLPSDDVAAIAQNMRSLQ